MVSWPARPHGLGCWWPGDTRSQGISNRDNNLVFGNNSRQVPLFCYMLLYQVTFTDVTMLTNPWITCYITKLNNEINSMASGRCGSNRKNVIWEIISCRLFAKLLSGECPNFFGDKSILVKVMAWCHQAPSHYLSQFWPTSMSPYDVTGPQWVKLSVKQCIPHTNDIIINLNNKRTHTHTQKEFCARFCCG